MEKREKTWLEPWLDWTPRWCPILYGATIFFGVFFIVAKRSPFEALFPRLWEKLLLTVADADDLWLFLWVDYVGSHWYYIPLFAAVIVTLGRWLFKRFPSDWRSCAREILVYFVGIFAVTYFVQMLAKWLY